MDSPLTKFEKSFMRTVWDAWVSDLQIDYRDNEGRQICRMIKAKVTSRSKFLKGKMVESLQDPKKWTLSLKTIDSRLVERLIHFLNLQKYDRVDGTTWAKTHVLMYWVGHQCQMEDLQEHTRTRLLHLWRLRDPAEGLKNSRTSRSEVAQSLADEVSEKVNNLCDCIPKIYEDPDSCPVDELMEGIYSLFKVMTPAQRAILNRFARKIPQFGEDLMTA